LHRSTRRVGAQVNRDNFCESSFAAGMVPRSAKAEVHDCVIREPRAVVQLHDKWQSSPCIGGHFVEP